MKVHESEDLNFQEGRALAQYLEKHPCPHIPKMTGHDCGECIADAIIAVEYQFAAEREKREKRPRTVPKVYGNGRPKPEVKGNGHDPLAFHFELERFNERPIIDDEPLGF